MDDLQEIPEADLFRVAMYLRAGFVPIRDEYNGVLIYYFRREDVEIAIEGLRNPELKPVLDYIETLKGLQVKASALKAAARKIKTK